MYILPNDLKKVKWSVFGSDQLHTPLILEVIFAALLLSVLKMGGGGGLMSAFYG
jgi:hypothetical protein